LSTREQERVRCARLIVYAEEDAMTDPKRDAHGPMQVPDEQPPVNPTDVTAQPALQAGATSRWILPAGVLALVAIVLYCFAFQIQIVLPIVGIVFVIVMWLMMFLVARRGGADKRTNRRLAWLMGGMAAGALLIAIGIYIVESTRLPWT
jgi:cytochrome bd-type quinol oxidase subunit 1